MAWFLNIFCIRDCDAIVQGRKFTNNKTWSQFTPYPQPEHRIDWNRNGCIEWFPWRLNIRRNNVNSKFKHPLLPLQLSLRFARGAFVHGKKRMAPNIEPFLPVTLFGPRCSIPNVEVFLGHSENWSRSLIQTFHCSLYSLLKPEMVNSVPHWKVPAASSRDSHNRWTLQRARTTPPKRVWSLGSACQFQEALLCSAAQQ